MVQLGYGQYPDSYCASMFNDIRSLKQSLAACRHGLPTT